MIEVPIEWILGIVGVLGGTITTLATIIWRTLKERLEVQDEIIGHLRTDIERMAKGCGVDVCHWYNR